LADVARLPLVGDVAEAVVRGSLLGRTPLTEAGLLMEDAESAEEHKKEVVSRKLCKRPRGLRS